MAKSLARVFKPWLILGTVILLLAVGVALALGASKIFPGLLPFTSVSESHDSQVIQSVTRTEQIALVSLGIQGISQQKGASKFYGVTVPGSERRTMLQYGFEAKLGVDGKDVTIKSAGEGAYVITVPRFIFIGHDNEKFETVIDENGALSWTTPEIDTAKMISGILSDSGKQEYIAKNEDLLKDQTKAFYGNIVRAIDPKAEVTFDFGAEGAAVQD